MEKIPTHRSCWTMKTVMGKPQQPRHSFAQSSTIRKVNKFITFNFSIILKTPSASNDRSLSPSLGEMNVGLIFPVLSLHHAKLQIGFYTGKYPAEKVTLAKLQKLTTMRGRQTNHLQSAMILKVWYTIGYDPKNLQRYKK